MLKCCKARFDVIVARPCEWIVSFDLDECSELRGIICELAWFDTANVNELPFNDKRDVGIAGDGIVSKPKLLSTDVDSSVVGDAVWLRRRWTINKSVYSRVLLLLFKIKCRKMRALADNDQHINQQIYRRPIQCSLAQQHFDSNHEGISSIQRTVIIAVAHFSHRNIWITIYILKRWQFECTETAYSDDSGRENHAPNEKKTLHSDNVLLSASTLYWDWRSDSTMIVSIN